MQLGDQFDSIDATRKAIKTYVLSQSESYKTVSSYKVGIFLLCVNASFVFELLGLRKISFQSQY